MNYTFTWQTKSIIINKLKKKTQFNLLNKNYDKCSVGKYYSFVRRFVPTYLIALVAYHNNEDLELIFVYNIKVQ